MPVTCLLLHLMAAACLLAPVPAQVPACFMREGQNKKNCFHDRNLDLTVMPRNLEVLLPQYEHYETFFTLMDPQLYCDQNLAAYMEAAECTVNVSKTCRDPDGSLNVVQDPHAVIVGMQRLCDLRDRVETECFKTFFHTANDCMDFYMPLLDISLFADSQDTITCRTTELLYDCMKLVLKPLCGDNSTNIYMEQIGEYHLPPVCRNGSEPTRSRERYFQQLQQPQVTTSTQSGAIPTVTTSISTTAVAVIIAGPLVWLWGAVLSA